jgi:hypothetical protein
VGQDQFHHKDTKGTGLKIRRLRRFRFRGWLRCQAKEGAVPGNGVFIAPAI